MLETSNLANTMDVSIWVVRYASRRLTPTAQVISGRRSYRKILSRSVLCDYSGVSLLIWCPLQSIALRYDFSPRLLGSMCSEPLKPIPIPPSQHISRLHGLRYLHREKSEPGEVDEKSILDGAADLEGRVSSSEQRSIRSTRPSLDLNHYRIVDDVWHFSSVDWGRNCKPVG